VQGNTLADPKFKDGDALKTFDYVVANPPFSDKRWSTGLDPLTTPTSASAFGTPPAKQGDYAYLLHIVRSLKAPARAPASCRTACCSAAMPRPTSAAT
jgi:type I restriction enzyme M protein